MSGAKLGGNPLRRVLEVPEVVGGLVDVAEDAVLVPAAPGMNEPLKRLVLAQPPEVARVIPEDEVAPVALAEEALAQVEADLGSDAHVPE
eukprot:15473785-Alexandrium_andersonii.AAC.1